MTETLKDPSSAGTTNDDGTQLSMTTKDMRRVISSSFLGSMIEFYDFVLYATAASIVFNRIFFEDLGPGFAIFASFATFAVGYIARPLGGIVFGHFGDTRGRKNVLVATMLMMGIASTLMGLLPPTAQIGIVAPITLVLLRIAQGISVGGEWGGAILVALEHAPKKRRGLASSLANAGGPAGAMLATVMLGLFSQLPEEQFLTWGWRIPFLLSVVILVIGLIVRLRVAETPMYKKIEEIGARRRVPIVEVVTKHWRAVVMSFLVVIAFTTTQGLMTVWGVSVAVASGAETSGVLFWKAIAAVGTVIVAIAAGRLSDRVGRRPVLILGCLMGAVLAFPIISLLGTGTVWGFAVAIVLGNGLIQGTVYGPVAAFVAEKFPTSVRFSGASVAYQGASTVGAGFSPLIATGLVLAVGGDWIVAVFWIAVLAVSATVVILSGESKDREIHTDDRVVPAPTRAAGNVDDDLPHERSQIVTTSLHEPLLRAQASGGTGAPPRP